MRCEARDISLSDSLCLYLENSEGIQDVPAGAWHDYSCCNVENRQKKG